MRGLAIARLVTATESTVSPPTAQTWAGACGFSASGPAFKGVADIFTKAKRSRIMAAVRGRGNKATELALMALLRTARITGWRRHGHILGRPDFVFARARLAIFVDGCFWHGCKLHGRIPTSNRKYWVAKIQRNMARDLETRKILRARGWRVVRIWEHQLKKRPELVVLRILNVLQAPVLASRARLRAGI